MFTWIGARRARALGVGRVGLGSLIGLLLMLALPAPALAADAPRRPKHRAHPADDMGFADMGAFGGEIRTPNLDSLAKDGVRFTNFYTTPVVAPRARCCSAASTRT